MNDRILVNSVLEWLPTESTSAEHLERILWVDSVADRVVVYSLNHAEALPIWRTYSEIVRAIEDSLVIRRSMDPYIRTVAPESDFLEKHRERWEKAWNVIKDMVTSEPEIYDEKSRGIWVRHACEEFGVTKTTVYKYLRKYWRGGKTKLALLPDYNHSGAAGQPRVPASGAKKRGRPSRLSKLDGVQKGVNVDADIQRIFAVGTHKFYNSKLKSPLNKAYKSIIGKYFNIGYRTENGERVPVLPDPSEYPTFGQYKYWFTKEFNLRTTVTARVGETGFNLRHRAVLGTSTPMARGPGSIFQLDATIADVYLVSRYDRTRIIGRPVIYVVIDVFSRLITGLAVTLKGPSWEGASLAIANATMNKKAFCQEYGIEIEDYMWPSCHLPKEILADRGEMLSKASDRLIHLGINVLNTPPYRADWKGIVEQTFRIANIEVIHWLPGAVRDRYRRRGEPDNRLDATLDLYEFTQILIKLILKHNQSHYMPWYQRETAMIQEHVDPVPLALWNWGIQHKSASLTQMPDNIVRLQLLPVAKASVTYKGIEFNGMHYSCERAIREQWFERARARGTSERWISHDLRTTDVIYIHLDEFGTMEPCELLERDARYKGQRLEDVLELQEMEKVSGDLFVGRQMQADVAYDAEVEGIVEKARKKTEAANPQKLSKRERTSSIRKNRADESERTDEQQVKAMHGDHVRAAKKDSQPVDKDPVVSFNDEPWNQRYSDRKSQDLAFLKSLHPDDEE
ncbi:DDE-type integrase/transposase/recombinase [Alicyclobacillus sp. SO9]|uniref:DDE-type integrase/transposase/recombinase n=1 Tax=Alicyclobacillus sp. SO9 TaxID=2665646 RepID=UPI0018E8C55C|nr:DDE-type integrase/transposase/recombinase [Alicyclobacillus sp. SO9]QQE78486.1 transposase family protein [Alicyclobacillus sp. SO9]